MVEVNFSIVYQIINFLILIWILNLVLYKPIRKMLNQRKETVSDFEQNITALGQEAKKQDNAYDLGIREARSNGKKEKEAMMEAASVEEKAILAKINTQAQADMTEVKNKIAKDVEKVGSALQNQVDDFAAAITQKILGRTV